MRRVDGMISVDVYALRKRRREPSAVFTCIGTLGTPSRTGPLARKYLPGFPLQLIFAKVKAEN